MAVPVIYRGAASAFVNKELDWDTETFSALLLTNTYTINKDTHVFVSDIVTGNEVVGGSYARVAVNNRTIDSTGAGSVKLKCDDIVFAAMTATNVNYCAIYRNTGADTTAKLLCVIQFDAAVSPAAQSVTIDLGVNGLVNLTV